MKILLISNFFPPAHTAGTERRTFGYASRLQELGYEVQVLCAGIWEDDLIYWKGYVEETYQQIQVHRINLNWSLAPDPNKFLYSNPLVENHLKQWLPIWKPDIVHITSCNTLSATVIQAAKDYGLPVVLTLTDFWFICPQVTLLKSNGSLCSGETTNWECLKCKLAKTKIYRGLDSVLPEKATSAILTWVSKHPKLNHRHGLRGLAMDMDHRKAYLPKMMQLVDRIIAPSSFLRDVIQPHVLKPIEVIQSGHDLIWLKTMPPKKPSEKLRLGYIGQVIPVKGVEVLVKAFIATDMKDKAQLAIFGDLSKEPAYVQQLRTISGIYASSIRFYGAFAPHKLGEVLSEIDVLIVPSLWHENNPRVIQEAFASKTPVIGSEVGGISEFVEHGVNGLLFKRNDVADLATQLKQVICQPSLLDTLRVGIQSVKTFAEEVSELEAIYQELFHFNQ